MGVSTASASPAQRFRIHSSTRMFCPKPGHTNLPFSSVRNQFTWNIFGACFDLVPIFSQWPK